jgi:hypothetical protein
MRSASGALGGAGGTMGGLNWDVRELACANKNDKPGVATGAPMDFPSTRSVPRRETNACGFDAQQSSQLALSRVSVAPGAPELWCLRSAGVP